MIMSIREKYFKSSRVPSGYVEKLKEYMLENQYAFFSEENMATAWCDFVQWPTVKVDREHLCMPEEVMIIDRNYDGVHMFCICTVRENRSVGKQEIPVIEVSRFKYWRNGYFLLPIL